VWEVAQASLERLEQQFRSSCPDKELFCRGEACAYFSNNKKKHLYSTSSMIVMDQLVITGKLVKSMLWFVSACPCRENMNV